MLSKLRRYRPSHATVVAYLALFVALGGSSYAAVTLSKNSVKSKHIGKGQVKRADVGKNAIDSTKVADASLLAADFAAGQLSAGPQGPQGLQGERGPAGSDAQFNGAAAGGDLTGTYPNPQLASDSVGSGEILADTIGSSEIAPGVVGADELDTVHEHFGPSTNITDTTAHDGSYTFSQQSVSCGAGEDLLSVSVDWTASGGHNERHMMGVASINRSEPETATVEVTYDGGATTATYVPVATCIF